MLALRSLLSLVISCRGNSGFWWGFVSRGRVLRRPRRSRGQQTPPKGNKKPCQNPLFRGCERNLSSLSLGFFADAGQKRNSSGRKGEKPCPSARAPHRKKEKPCPSARAPHRKKEKPCPDRGNNDDNSFFGSRISIKPVILGKNLYRYETCFQSQAGRKTQTSRLSGRIKARGRVWEAGARDYSRFLVGDWSLRRCGML
jgi:hypothetical protein